MVLTLDQIAAGTPGGPSLAVLGSPVRHSLSPAMHNAALAAMAGSVPAVAGWRYHAVEVAPGCLAAALPRLCAAGFVGLNLTIPHKVDVLPLLAAVDPGAACMGAVNTLVARADGWHGYNTDGYGIAQAVTEAFGDGLAGADVLVIGAGGAARAIGVQCLLDGCARLTVVNRSVGRRAALRAQLATVPGTRADVRCADWPLPAMDWQSPPLVINASSLGLHADDPPPLDVALLPAGSRIMDTTYGCHNALATAAARQGVAYADGLAMLVWQGVRSLEIWTGQPVPVPVMAAAARAALAARSQSKPV
jgi:shikimate dehydrogenase